MQSMKGVIFLFNFQNFSKVLDKRKSKKLEEPKWNLKKTKTWETCFSFFKFHLLPFNIFDFFLLTETLLKF